nr:PREDICTED: epiplakin isoform X1 [Anolis carolinensis]|eukprot:XP_016854476.1 PREDICTED: epiplakin isoform X1 [Anolis carolinensis]
MTSRQVLPKGHVGLAAVPGSRSPPSSATGATGAGMRSGSIAGAFLEVSGRAVSLSDAVREHLLQPDLALTLLEAQAATGGIVDLARKELLPVAEAVARGLVGLEQKEKLLCAERAVTGFPDPYTEEKIPLYQAVQKELLGREQGLRLLEAQMATGGIIDPATRQRLSPQEAYAHGHLEEDLHAFLSDPGNEEAKAYLDPNSHQKVTYSELMRRCVADPGTGLLLLPLKVSFPGLRGAVCSHELLDSGVIDSATFRALHNGELTAQDVAEMDTVQQYLSGTHSIAGVANLQTGECKSLSQALSEHLLMPGTAEILLQAQAATGGLIDPVRNKRLALDEAVRSGVVGPELYEKLSSAERAITGHRDPYTGETLSLFQALRKGLVPRDPGLFLLEAQLATGGIVDPHTHHRLPVEVACQRGHLDTDTHSRLSQPKDDLRGFFDPNSKRNLSYAELLSRCVTDPDTGLCLLPLYGDPRREHPFIEPRTQRLLRNTLVPVASGKFRGQSTSLWKLLFSDYFSKEQRRDLLQQFHSGGLSIRRFADMVCNTVQEVSANPRITFEGLRSKVTPAQLLSSEIINKDLFEKLTQGETLAKDVVSMSTVKKYLEGTGSISGLLLPDSQERIGIYQAKRKGLLRPGTSLVLLEAQAATGHIIDPAANKKYSVNEALQANVIGPDVYDKLLAAEKAVTGYRDPYTGSKISLFQAMRKDLIVKEHAIRLLEAQVATGGIIDPVNSHRLPVEAAYKRGYFDKKMNLILSDLSDDTKGFFDPNTHENLTYLQLKEKCITEPTTGLCLLPLNSKRRQFIDDATKQGFRTSWLLVKYGRFQGQRVSLWDLLNSEYFTEGKRREIFNHYRLQKLSLEQIHRLLEEEMKKWARIQFPAVRGQVTAYHLVETGILDRALFERLLDGAVSPEEVLRMESVRKYLYGTGSIGGIVLQPSNERVSLYEAIQRNIVLPGVALPLLEAQAATGFIIDPVSNQKLSLDDAVKEGLVGPELYEKLQRAEEAVTGYKDPFTGKKISLFQAMQKGLVADKQAIQLMDAQMSTGGVIDPHSGHYVPIEFAQKKGYLDEGLCKALSDPNSDTKLFSSLDKKESVSYGQLIDQCQKDDVSGIRLLPLSQEASPVYTEEQMERLFRATLMEDRGLSLWEVLHSGYFTEEQRRELFEKYTSEAVSLQQLVSLVREHIQEIEMKARTQVTFQGLKGAVPAVWLLDTGIISEKTFAELAQGRTTAREVSEMESVKKYLQGTGAIAGVLLQSSGEKMDIYQAMQKSLLLPGTGARLLEAQAATGSITDPADRRRLGVMEAIRAGLVGKELMERLLQAERALVGYPDPYSGKPLSVCQAIRKELIPATAGIPLLEAQLAAGGVIDPVHCHHLPLPAAYKHGFYDEDMHKVLSQHGDDTCVFFDPNTQESLTYQQLKDRCARDAETGLLLLPLSDEAAFYGDRHTMEVLKSVRVGVNIGRYKGQEVSLWDLLNSEYIDDCKRRELVLTYKEENDEALQEIATAVTKIIAETEHQGRRFAFKGLRKQVSASDLFQSQLIDKETLDDLSQGKKTVQEVTEMESVRRYLEGGNFIAGVLLQPSQERMSICRAMRQGLLRPGAALVLLEAQAATGFLLDPVKNKKLSVDEALSSGLIGREVYEKLLSAEKAVTGYTHPYTKERISLFEAMNEELIVRSHGIRLLEAQVATGGIIDPVHSHRIPVEVAYKRGYFDEELNQILLDLTDDTKGFFDPNTHENLTYLQLLERCVKDPETGLYMLQIVRRGGRYFYIDEATKQFLKAQPMEMHLGRYKGQAVSVWDLLCSPYIQEEKRKELVSQYKDKRLTLEELGKTITAVVEETERKAHAFRLKGLREEVSAAELFNAEIIDKKTLDGLNRSSLPQLAQKDSVKRFLEGTGCIAGVVVGAGRQKMGIYEAMKRGLVSPEHALMLLEAQAATGFIVDPVKKKSLSVEQAISAGLVGEELHQPLLFAERAVTGYTDPSTGEKASLYQAMKKNMVDRGLALRLLEAQLATGGIVDPLHSHRIPVEVAFKRGHLDDDTFLLLSDAEYAAKGFVDPNTQERITYTQLLPRCVRDPETGMYLLQLMDKKEYFYVDELTRNILSSTKVNVTLGKYKGQSVSLWELLSSDYVDEEKRKELIKKYKAESSAILQHIVNEIMNIIKEKEVNRRDIWFQGLRKQVTASELLKADIIGVDTMKNLEEGKQSAQDVAEIDSVKQYLEGTGCIAGVLVPSKADPSKMEKMAIYQAMWKGLLRPGTALVLLEAQAATGFITDPLKNRKLSVEEADAAGLVGPEILHKLLAAEKAVTGYTDPNTGKKISLFQALKKELILKEHGVRLLEAQIATGGIIDPVNSHRVPVEVAYKRGYFDEEMNQSLSDSTEDTKGFFDPNTHENLTYMQLLKRCILDPDTGLRMLQVQPDGSSAFYLDEHVKKTLKSTTTRVSEGCFQGQETSVWDLLFSGYFTDRKREEILTEFRAGKLTIHEIITILKSTIKEKENKENLLKTTKIARNVESTGRQQPTMWEVLFSGDISEFRREELLNQFRNGTLTLVELTNVLDGLLTEAQAGKREHHTASEAFRGGVDDGDDDDDNDLDEEEREDDDEESVVLGEKEKILKSRLVEVAAGEFHGRKVSVWEILHSKYIPEKKRKELLRFYKSGILTIDQMETVVTAIVNRTEEEKRKGESGARHHHEGHWEDALRNHTVVLHVGEFQGQEVSLWDLLFSQYVPEPQREELLMKFRYRLLSIEEMIVILAPLLTQKEPAEVKEVEDGSSPSRRRPHPQEGRASRSPHGGDLKSALCMVSIDVPVGEFQGNRHSVWELLFSKYVTEEKRQELLEKYRAGLMSSEELVRTITSLIEEMEKKSKEMKFRGLRRQVTASELFDSQIIGQDTLSELTQGTKTVEDITNMDSVKRYLEGRSCIAGVLVPSRSDPSKMEKVTIYQAMWKNILRPGTALVLLEAQAATGFITDPLQNRKLSVEEAISAELVGAELREKLLSAERAVTGYKDPYTGHKISLFQAMKKGLIVKDHGIRLLEAQIATGGIIDPVQSHRLPVEVAYKRGYFDEDMNRILSDPTDDTKGFFDPNTQENLTYMQLLQRCLPDPETGLLMLHVMDKGSFSFLLTEKTRRSLQTAKTRVDVELFQGQEVSVWDLLFSRYILPQKRQELLGQYKQGAITLGDLTQILTTIITETQEKRIKLARQQQAPGTLGVTSPKDGTQIEENWQKTLQSTTFKMPAGENQGQVVVVWDMLFSNYLTEEKRTELLDLYQRGLIPVDQLANILIVLIEKGEATRRKFDIKVRGPDKETVLLERTSGVSSPCDQNWEDALRSQLIQVDLGEYQDQQVSVWDLLFSRYILPQKRQELLGQYKQGAITLADLTQILTTIISETEEKRAKLARQQQAQGTLGVTSLKDGTQIEENWQKTLKSTTIKMPAGENQGQVVVVWDMLFSNYLTEEKRTELLDLYQRGLIPVDQLANILIALIEKGEATRRKFDIKVRGPGRSVDHGDDDGDDDDDDDLDKEEGEDDDEESVVLGEKEKPLKSRLVEVAAGEFHGRKVSVWEILHSKYIPEEKRKELLRFYKSGILTIDQMETVVTAIVNRTEEEKRKGESGAGHHHEDHWEDALRNHTVALHVGEFQGQEVSLRDLLFSQYVPEPQREELLMKFRYRLLSIEEMIVILAPLLTQKEPADVKEVEDGSSPSRWRPYLQEGRAPRSPHGGDLKSALCMVSIDVPVGEFQGSRCSVWELLFSKYVTEEKRQELLEKYRAGLMSSEELVRTITSLIEEMEKKSKEMKFRGLRRQVTASELFDSQIIGQDTLSELTQGTKTVEDITNMDSVKRYLEGRSCIAGVLVPSRSDPSKMEKVTIYQAMWKNILRPGTALVLLEAQAATGFITDPLQNRKLSVEEAVSAELVGAELREKLLSAERAVTGYKDPYTGHKISLFQAMKKGLIVKDHGIRLLEAQIATGGIIDPVQSHRLPVEVAYKRGYFDEDMNRILSDPTDDTKGFFDPNTQENLTYMQLLQRCLPDPETGLLMLHVMDKGSFSFLLTEKTRRSLQTAKTRVDVELFQGQEVSVWDLLFSRYILPQKRQELLGQYKQGAITLADLTQILTTTITETEEKRIKLARQQQAPGTLGVTSPKDGTQIAENWQKTLQSTTFKMPAGENQGQVVVVWDMLFSNYLTEEKRTELLDLYQRGLIPVDQLANILIALIEKGEATRRKFDIKVRGPGRSHSDDDDDDDLDKEEGEDDDEESVVLGEKEKPLKSRLVEVAAGEFHGRKVSVWEILHSKYIPEEKRKELLRFYKSGILTIDQMETVVTAIVNRTEEEKRKEESGAGRHHEDHWEDALRNHTVALHVGEFQGQEVSLRDLLFSKYISDGKREELLGIYRACQLTPEELTAVLSALITQVSGERKEGSAPSSMPPGVISSGKSEDGSSSESGEKEQALKSRMVEVTTGELHGQKVSIWEVLHSKSIPEEKQKELLQLYKSGILSTDQMETVVTAIVNRKEEKEHSSHTRDHSASPQEDPIPESSYYDFVHHTLRQENVDVTIREIQDERSSLWDPYFSRCVSNFKKEEILHRHGSPTVSVKECVKIITTLLSDTEDQASIPERSEFTVMEKQMSPQTATAFETEHEDGTEHALKSRLISLPTDRLGKESISLWDGLHSDHIPEEKKKKLLRLYKSGDLTIDQMETAITALVNRTEEEEAEEEAHAHEDHWKDTLQNHTVVLNVGRCQHHEVSLWDLLCSQDIPEEKREELLNRFRRGSLTLEELSDILRSLLAEAKAGKREHAPASEVSRLADDDGDDNDDDDDATDKEEGEEDNKDAVVLGEKEKALKSRLVTVAAGEFHGRRVSIWEVLHSKYIPEEKRKELLKLYKFGILSTDQMKTVVTAIVNRTEEEKRKEESGAGHGHENDWEDTLRNHTVVLHVGEFQGQEVSLWNLLFSHYIPEDKREELLRQHRNGNLNPDKLANILCGLLAEANVEEGKHHTTPETTRDTDEGDDDDDDALGKEEGEEEEEDPVELGEKEKALKSRLVTVAAGEFHGQKVSIWEILHSKYIPEKKRKELLRLYKSGILSTDQMETIVTSIVNRTEEEKRKEESGATHSHEGHWEDALRNHIVILNVGEFQGQEVSLWDLLFSHYIPEEKREELLRQHRNGNLNSEELANIVRGLLAAANTEEGKHHTTPETTRDADEGDDDDDDDALGKEEGEDEEDPVELGEKEKALKSRLVSVTAGEFHGKKVSIWEILHSKYIPEEKLKDLLKLYKSGILSTDQMETIVTSIVNRTEEEKRKEESGAAHSHEGHWEDALRNHIVILNVGEFQGQEVSLWDLLSSQYIPEEKREELLRQHRNGNLNSEELANIVRGLLAAANTEEGKHHTTPETTRDADEGDDDDDDDDDDALGKEEGEDEEDPVELGEKEKALKSRLVSVAAGEFHGKKVSIWEILHSKYIPEEKLKELLKLYKSGILSTDQMETIVTSIVNRTEEEKRKEESGATHSHEGHWEDALRNHIVILNVGEFQGQEVSLWDLLSSQYIPEEKREELLRQHRNGNLNSEELANILSGLLAESTVREKKHHKTPDTTRDTDDVDNDNDALGKEEVEEEEEDPVELGEKEKALKSRLVKVAAGEFHGQKVSIWEILHSKYIPEEKRKELLKLYQSDILSTDQMETVVTSIVNRTEEESSSKPLSSHSPREEARSLDTIQNICSPESSSLEDVLRSESFVVPIGEFEGQRISCWDVLSSKYISEDKKQELLCRLREEDLHVPDLVTLLTEIITETERPKAEEPGGAAEGGSVEERGEAEAQEDLKARQQQLKRSLRTTLVPVSVGEFKGQRVCVLDLLFSKYVPQDKRQELLEEYRAGTLPMQEMVSTLTAMIEEAESKRGKRGGRRKMSCMKGKLCWTDRGTHP